MTSYLDAVPIGWRSHFSSDVCVAMLERLVISVYRQRPHTTIYPTDNDIFRPLSLVGRPQDVKVVILGEQPYHQHGLADGLAFSVATTKQTPGSLLNILREVKRDVGVDRLGRENGGDLRDWAKQGVLLWNIVPTVEKDRPGSHVGIGWEIVTQEFLKSLSKLDKYKIFMLWGRKASSMKEFIYTSEYNSVLETSHPSPETALNGFRGCGHFSKVKGIDW